MKKVNIYNELSKNYEKELIANLSKFVAINSVYDEQTVSKENPFGQGVTNALEFFANLAKEDGYKVTNYDNMVVEVLAGDGDKNITILAHADVVPAGNAGWKQDPFSVTEHHGVLCGRGVADDKGPLLAAYYGMKMITDNHLQGDYQIRFIVGGNEETGSRGVEHYFKHLKKPQPTLGFSPDAEYPLIYAEKGIVNFEITNDFAIPGVYAIKGGVASNSVIEKCTITMVQNMLFIRYLKDNKIAHEVEIVGTNKMNVIFTGVAAHGATPEAGVNAAMVAINALDNYLSEESLHKITSMFNDLNGRGINAYAYSRDMGTSSMNLGIVDYENNHFKAIVNYRHVDGITPEEVISRVEEAVKPFTSKVLGISPLLYYPKDSTLVSTLLRVYQEETGDYKSEPKAIGGGTYAKEADNVIAYGMELPGWDSKMHSPGESVRKKDLFTSIGIYAHAIVELGKKL